VNCHLKFGRPYMDTTSASHKLDKKRCIGFTRLGIWQGGSGGILGIFGDRPRNWWYTYCMCVRMCVSVVMYKREETMVPCC
jgi:hypothetical protein